MREYLDFFSAAHQVELGLGIIEVSFFRNVSLSLSQSTLRLKNVLPLLSTFLSLDILSIFCAWHSFSHSQLSSVIMTLPS